MASKPSAPKPTPKVVSKRPNLFENTKYSAAVNPVPPISLNPKATLGKYFVSLISLSFMSNPLSL